MVHCRVVRGGAKYPKDKVFMVGDNKYQKVVFCWGLDYQSINDFFGYDLIQDSFNRTNLILLIILLFLLFYLIKSIYLVFLYIYTKRFGINHEEFLAQNVYSNYVYSDFIESTHKDKSKTFRNIHEVAAHTSCLQATFVINQEILTFFFNFPY